MQFWKMNGAGNDFIILNNMVEELPAERFPALARRLCRRRFSIGADGLMVVEKPEKGGDYRMRFYNADGSVGEMCGNGARCICRYGYETGLAGATQRVETTAGRVTGERISQREYRVELNRPTTLRLEHPVTVDGRTYPCSYVELGEPGLPHAVVPLSGLRSRPEGELLALGRKLRAHPAFPKGANINFYEVEGPGRIWERTYERGVEDFTCACGTGTGSVAAVLTLRGVVSGQGVRVQMTGGELVVDVECRGGAVERLFLTGPAHIVAKGEVAGEELPV